MDRKDSYLIASSITVHQFPGVVPVCEIRMNRAAVGANVATVGLRLLGLPLPVATVVHAVPSVDRSTRYAAGASYHAAPASRVTLDTVATTPMSTVIHSLPVCLPPEVQRLLMSPSVRLETGH